MKILVDTNIILDVLLKREPHIKAAQIIMTKAYVNRNDMTQAFARNQLAIAAQSGELPDICQEGGWIMGKMPGRLSTEEKQKIAQSLFGYEGGGNIMEQETKGYYVAYGYTNGINMVQRVNGKMINMNVAITYDENEDKSVVYFGVPILNQDF